MTDEEIPIEQEKKPLKNMLKIFSVIAFIVMIMVFIIIKISKDDFPLKWFFIIGIPMFILFLITFFIFEISAKIKNRKKDVGYGRLPIAISEFDCLQIAKKLLASSEYLNKIDTVYYSGTEEHGKGPKQQIWSMKCGGLYPNGSEKVSYFVGVNRHFPDIKKIVINPSRLEILRGKRLLATDPEDEPDIERTISENVLTGTKVVTEKRTKKQKQQEAAAKKGELA